MKIVLLIQDVTTDGGAERCTIGRAEALKKEGAEVCIVSAFRSRLVPVFGIDPAVRVVYATEEVYELPMRLRPRIRKIMRARRALKACKELREADRIICQKSLASVLCWSLGMSRKSWAAEHYRYAMYNPVVRWWRNRLYNRFESLVVLTEKDKEAFMKHGVRRVQVIPNRVSIRPLPWRGADSHIIVGVGRLTWQKGWDRLLEVLAPIREQMGDWQVEIYGEGEERERLQGMISRYHLEDRVRLMGFATDITRVYQKAGLLVMTSRFEGMPMVLIEAKEAGVPILSFDCEEGPAVILGSGGGELVKDGDIGAFRRALMKVIGIRY